MADFGTHVRTIAQIPPRILSPLQDRVAALSESQWERADLAKPNKFAVFKDAVQHFVFQFPLSLNSHLKSGYTARWVRWKAVVLPIIDSIGSFYCFRKPKTARIMLAKLRSGGLIPDHIDGSPSAVTPHKIHVPLFTDPKIVFTCEDKSYHLETGSAYEVNNQASHGGRNDSLQDRVHLIFDYFEAEDAL